MDRQRLLQNPNSNSTQKKKEPVQMQRMQPRAKFSILACFIAATLVGIVILIVMIFTTGSTQTETLKTGKTPNEVIYGLASSAFLDTTVLELMQEAMENLTLGCTPPPSDPIYGYLTLGSVQQTTDGFQRLKSYLADQPMGSSNCLLYGVNLAEYRAGTESGAANICYGYVFAGLQAIALELNYTMPTFVQLESVVSLAWPLTLFWSTSNPGRGSTDAVVAQLYPLLQNFITGTPSTGGRNATVVAQQFCNQYFSTNNLQFWDPTFLSWYGFWAPTAVNRISQNFVPQTISTTLQTFDLYDIQNTTRIKAVYLIGPTCDQQPACLQFLDSGVSDSPVYRISDTDMTAILQNISQGLYQVNGNPSLINNTLVPILIITNYLQNKAALDVFVSPANSIFFAFTITPSQTNTNASQSNTIDADAISNNVMATMDYSTPYAFDSMFGDQFFIAKKNADFFVSVAQSGVIAGATGSVFLLPTFAIKNTQVNGYDVGGDLTKVIVQQQAMAAGYSTGLYIEPYSVTLNFTYVETTSIKYGSTTVVLPDSYNYLDYYPGVDSQLSAYPESDQKNCQNCWDRSATLAMSWRCYKRYGGDYNLCSLSPHHVLTCSYLANGCMPQNAATAFGSMQGDIPMRTCMPQIYQGSQAPPCPSSCSGKGTFKQVGGVVPGSLAKLNGVDNIKREMYVNGPVMLTFNVPADFYSYYKRGKKNTSPYAPTKIEPLTGGHAIMCYGWQGPNFLCQNSWGTDWNGDGRFSVEAYNPVYSGKSTWFDTDGYTAEYRVGTVYPDNQEPTDIVVVDPITNKETTVAPQPANPIINPNCAQVVINTQDSLSNAAIQGCPANKKKKSTSGSNSNSNSISSIMAIFAIAIVLAVQEAMVAF